MSTLGCAGPASGGADDEAGCWNVKAASGLVSCQKTGVLFKTVLDQLCPQRHVHMPECDMAVSVKGEEDEKPMDTETGKTGDDDEKMTEAEREGAKNHGMRIF